MPNKKADEKLLSFYWILIMIFVAFCLVVCVLMVNGGPTDVRKVEADILANRLIDCIIDNGFIRADMANDFKIEEKCGFNFNDNNYINGGVDKSQYYVRINVLGIEGSDKDKSFFFIETEDGKDIRDFCTIQAENDNSASKLPKCTEKEVYSVLKINGAEIPVKLNVYTGIKKGDKNAQ